MFKYKLQTPLGEDIGVATPRFLLEPGEELTIENNQRLRVIKVVPSKTGGQTWSPCCTSRQPSPSLDCGSTYAVQHPADPPEPERL